VAFDLRLRDVDVRQSGGREEEHRHEDEVLHTISTWLLRVFFRHLLGIMVLLAGFIGINLMTRSGEFSKLAGETPLGGTGFGLHH
jgi:hypothetical protein